MREVICERCGAIGIDKDADTSKNGEKCRKFKEGEFGGIVKITAQHEWVER